MQIIRSDIIETREPVIITASEFRGKNRLDVRHHFLMGNEPHPTKHGVNILLSEADEILQAIKQVTSGTGVTKVETQLANTMIVTSTSVYMGTSRLDLRHYWKPEGKDEYLPTQKGVNIPLDLAEVFIREFENVINLAKSTTDSRFANVEA